MNSEYLNSEWIRDVPGSQTLNTLRRESILLMIRLPIIQWQPRQCNKPLVLSRWRPPNSWFVIARNSPNQEHPFSGVWIVRLCLSL
jgi:hypothetical protein